MRIHTITALTVASIFAQFVNADPQTPEEFFGHQVGADYTLVKWPKIVEYFEHMAAESDKIFVRDIGATTEGNRMILAEISTADTVTNLSRHRSSQQKIADPRTIRNDSERDRLISETKVPILVNCQLHSNETAGSQMSMELAYNLITSDSEETQEILEHCIILLVPCANPDGQIMVAEWYERSLGTSWEGYSTFPRLYQKYAGHDNNRDWFMLNLEETRNTTKVLYEEWFPTIVWDVHQMGNSGARLFVPPFHDPKNYNVHPVIDQTLLIIGGHMAGDLARNGRKGVVHSAIYDNWWAGGFRTTPYRHNMVGILTEAASVNLASPVFQRKSQLRGSRRGMQDYSLTTNFPDPWNGGWWRLRDIVEYELDIAMSLFTLASRYHDRFQSNFIHMNEDAINKGETEPPYAWLVPPDQRDPRSVYEMLTRLDATAIEIHQAEEEFVADGVTYPEDTYIMYTAQPFRPHLMDMMERQVYPDRLMYPGGPAEPPYDMAGWTLPIQMGVRHVEVNGKFDVRTTEVDTIEIPKGSISIDDDGNVDERWYVIDAGGNDFYRLRNRLFDAGIPVKGNHQSIAFRHVDVKGMKQLEETIEDLSVDVNGRKVEEAEKQYFDSPQPRVALYHPWTSSMEEGWTRLVLDNHEFKYSSIYNAEIASGNLNARYDCIILPSIRPDSIIEGYSDDATAPEYAGGIGLKGVMALQEFVDSGGTLVCMDQSTNLVLDHFNVPVKNIVRGLPSAEFFCPGSVLRLKNEGDHALTIGMPKNYSGYFARSQAFELIEEEERARSNKEMPVHVVSRYSDTLVLDSGWIRGDELIADKPAILDIQYGEGNVFLFGISVQRRGQPHETFKLLFNAIQASTM
jgi:hypothetical protein